MKKAESGDVSQPPKEQDAKEPVLLLNVSATTNALEGMILGTDMVKSFMPKHESTSYKSLYGTCVLTKEFSPIVALYQHV
ncbi:hypothetical protein STEG23_014104 [Scotinomys teguina]